MSGTRRERQVTNCQAESWKGRFAAPFLHLAERLIKAGGRGENDVVPTFIVGAPRTGSTILYQYLTNSYEYLYISNLSCRLHRNLLLGTWLTERMFPPPHDCFTSVHGGTTGQNAPSECGRFWYQWLPKDRHFIDLEDVPPKTIETIRQAIKAPIDSFEKQFLFKNLNAGQRIRLITAAFPDARFLFLRRNAAFTAQSILAAKRSLGIKQDQYWSVRPKNFNILSELPWNKQIVGQVYSIEKQINDDLHEFASESNVVVLDFESLTNDIVSAKLQHWLPTTRSGACGYELSLSNRVSIDRDDFRLIEQEVARLDWKHYSAEFSC